MDEYIRGMLVARFIHPSSSVVRAGFLFLEKKDKSLRPCIDYCPKDIAIKNRYLLISSAFELFQGAWIFSKLSLRNACHRMGIQDGDEWKNIFNMGAGVPAE